MKKEIIEELLEMYYLHPMAELLADHYGLNVFRIWKPTRNREAFLAFDHGWVSASVNNLALDQQLDIAINQKSKSGPNSLYMGYFLQFKVVEYKTRTDPRTRGLNTSIRGAHYRCELRTDISKSSGRRQHNTLVALSQMRNADVYYACPLLLKESDVVFPETLDKLKLIQVEPNTPKYSSGKHFLAFQDKDSNAEWWSEINTAKKIPVENFPEKLGEPMTASKVKQWLLDARNILLHEDGFSDDSFVYPTAMTVIELQKATTNKKM